jgi:hypothetical protein
LRIRLLSVAALALIVAPSAAGKFGIKLELSAQKPRVGQSVRVVLRTDRILEADQNLRLIAVSPRLTSIDIRLVRTAPDTWRGLIRFSRRGSWRLVVPNWAAPGWAYPVPLERRITVLPQRR